MNKLPSVKVGIVVGSTDWMSDEIAIRQRKKIMYDLTFM